MSGRQDPFARLGGRGRALREGTARVLARSRPAPGWLLLAVLAFGWTFTYLAVRDAIGSRLFAWIEATTAGLVTGTLIANLAGFALFALIVFGIGRQRPRNVGLLARKARTGLLHAFWFWLIWQALVLALAFIGGGAEPVPNPAWSAAATTAVIGALLAQLFGVALLEETIYRGFLLPQLVRVLRRRVPGRAALHVTAAVLLSALLFAAEHVPNVVRLGYPVPPYLVVHTLTGIIYALLYLYSGNLFFVIGLHALGNWQMPLILPGIDPGLLWFLAQFLLVMAWSVVLVLRNGRGAPARQPRVLPPS